MKIQEILTKAGHRCEGDNRSRAIKGCNTSLKAGIKINVCEKGRHWTTKATEKPFNVKVSGFGLQRVYLFKNNGCSTTPTQILRLLAVFIKDERIRDGLKLSSATPQPCGKCSGVGFIPAFAHYADGVCFDCMGMGFTGKINVFETSKKTT
jgi:hypothetical protein